ncbi:coenzyme F420-reducing hydrogenase, FrhD protein [Methanocaldococcus indicus]|uniref:coenzyme F420-reducing hydrogenase, FrhD protein n=1 Tax=Methanocaldococcus indicus TaxID=213231 RepID=UPI003C6D236B
MIPDYLNKEILILGCGNLLFGDDGFGYFVVEKLNKILSEKEKENISILDVGTGAGSILTLLDKDTKVKKIIVVDVIDYGLKPGEIKVLDVNDLPDIEYDRTDAHGWKLSSILKDIHATLGIEIKVIGCQAKYIPAPDVKIGLSEEVEKAVDKAVEIILKELGD